MRSLTYVVPELVLVGGSVAVLLGGIWVRSRKFVIGLSTLCLVAALVILLGMNHRSAQEAFNGLIVFDSFGLFFSVFAVCAVLLGVFTSARSKEISDDRASEYFSILLALCTGLIFMSISNSLLMAYVALETVSILSYTLAGFHREKSASVEAALKYVVYGSMASGVMIYGVSLLYGATGHLEMTGLRSFFQSTPAAEIPGVAYMGILLMFAGLGYKISAAPMHMWTPDVYEGAPTPVSGLLSVAPKAAGFALLLRFFLTSFSLPVEGSANLLASSADPAEISFHLIEGFPWTKGLLISSIFTMFMGNLAALGQISVKRILAYSSIAHAGYILMGASTQTSAGVSAILFYLVTYCLMNIGAFYITAKVDDMYGGDTLRHFKGLGLRHPLFASAMAVFLFSLVGLPPFAGFVGKLYLFSSVLAREMYGLALFAAINSVISLGYYARIIKAMFLEAAEVEPVQANSLFASKMAAVLVLFLAIPTLVLGLYWEPVMKLASSSLVFFVDAR